RTRHRPNLHRSAPRSTPSSQVLRGQHAVVEDPDDLEAAIDLAEEDHVALAPPPQQLGPHRHGPRKSMLAWNDVLTRFAKQRHVPDELLFPPLGPRVDADLEQVVLGLLRVVDDGQRVAFARRTLACTRSQTPGLARRLA